MRYPFELSNKDVVALGAAFVLVLSTATAAVAQAVGSDTQSVVVTKENINDPVVADRLEPKAEVVLANAAAGDAALRTMRAIRDEKKLEREVGVKTQALKTSKLDSYVDRRKPLEPIELKELLYLTGFRGESLKLAWGIVMRESRGGPTAHNGNSNTGDNSYGLFQINMIGGLGADRREKFGLKTNEELFDPVTNARIAFHMSGGGEDFGAWGVGPNAYNGGKVGDLYSWVAKFPES